MDQYRVRPLILKDGYAVQRRTFPKWTTIKVYEEGITALNHLELLNRGALARWEEEIAIPLNVPAWVQRIINWRQQ